MSGNPIGWDVEVFGVDGSTAAGSGRPGAGGAESRAPRMSGPRLREVLDRLRSGFYDSPGVLRHVARRAVRDLDGSE